MKVTKAQRTSFYESWRETMWDRSLTRCQLVVLWTIADTNFENFFMSQGSIAKKVGYPQQKVSEAIKRLAERGDIIILERPKVGSHKPLKITLSDERKKLFSKKMETNSYHVTEGLHETGGTVSPTPVRVGHTPVSVGEEKKSSLSYTPKCTNVLNDNKLTKEGTLQKDSISSISQEVTLPLLTTEKQGYNKTAKIIAYSETEEKPKPLDPTTPPIEYFDVDMSWLDEKGAK